MSVHIDKIRIDGGTQSRAAINEATVAEYAEAMEDPNTVFPPAVVYFDGSEYWLADGFHRLEAWRRIGRTDIPTDVRQGDRRRAILHSVAANSAHGLRRTNEDKRRAVLTLLEDAEWSQWTDSKIARQCGVSQPFVSGLRRELSQNGFEMPAKRQVERGGKVYTQNTANIGKAAQQPAAAERQPDTSSATEEAPACQPPEADPQPEPDPLAPYRKGLSALTREGLEDEAAGLRAENAELRSQLKMAKAEVRALKEQIANLSADDKGTVIRRLEKAVEHKGSELFRANEKFAAEKRLTYRLKKEVEELRRKLEMQEIPL